MKHRTTTRHHPPGPSLAANIAVWFLIAMLWAAGWVVSIFAIVFVHDLVRTVVLG